MKPPPEPILSEAGLTITATEIITPSHRFLSKNIKRVTLTRVPPVGFLDLFKKRPYRLLINDFKSEHAVFETYDKGLVQRINAALTRASESHMDNKKLVRKV